jgi:transcriptional regulator with XRE-family HTH domain
MRLLRAKRGLTQEALAYESGINRVYLSSVERGERNISIDNIAALKAILRVPQAQSQDLLPDDAR